VKRTLGEEHPYTLVAMQNLATTYKRLGGRLKEVRELKEKVVEVRKRTLGEDRRDTADAMYNLALTLYDLKRLEEAILLMEEAACSYARIYGSDHSRTNYAEQALKVWKHAIEDDDDGEDSIYGEGAEDSDKAE
jgi:tetratricopeptide (TPR) repeat protein